MRPRLLALDLDGTLLTEDCQLPMGHVHAVRAIRRLGIDVVIATGRGLLTTRWVWRALGLQSPLVCFNGGWVGHPDNPRSWMPCGTAMASCAATPIPRPG
jgi:5-amino-6-(5-phospho-D-ribitylamino)uracil phosphatase